MLLLDPDWCAISSVEEAEVSEFPLCILHGTSDLNNPMYEGMEDRLKAVY